MNENRMQLCWFSQNKSLIGKESIKKQEQRDFIAVTEYIHEDKWMTFKKASIYPQVKEEVVAVLNNMSQFTKTHTTIKWNISLH